MPEVVLTVLRLCLLALLYLFFLRVLRAVWVEVRTEGSDVRTGRGSPVQSRPRKPARRSAVGGSDAGSGSAAVAGGGAGTITRTAVGPPRDIIMTDEHGHVSSPIAIAGLVTLGRADSCEVQILDTFASQMHARVFDLDGVSYVEDLNSTNGTYLNDTKIVGTSPVKSGDVVRIGNTALELR